jgi:hypothetical protein
MPKLTELPSKEDPQTRHNRSAGLLGWSLASASSFASSALEDLRPAGEDLDLAGEDEGRANEVMARA